MSGKVFFITVAFLSFLSFKKTSPEGPPVASIIAEYEKADRLFYLSNNNPGSDSICRAGFLSVTRTLLELPDALWRDSLLSQSFYKLGIMYDIHQNYKDATSAYCRAIQYTAVKNEIFRLNVLAGAAYYNQNNFDSSEFFLHQADQNENETGSYEDRVRLYNTLGVLYYDNGNFLQSKNYFTQALRLITPNRSAEDFAFSLQLNMATCYYKLGMFEQALAIYRKIQIYHLFPDALYMNMGRAYSGLHRYDSALLSFRKVKVTAVPSVLNEMGRVYLESGNSAEAARWLSNYRAEKFNLNTNILDDGVNEMYTADIALFKSDPAAALPHLQRALILFSGNFSSSDLRMNPNRFTGTFAYYRLFEVLDKKAAAWEMSYKKTGLAEDLKSAYDSYQASIELLSYIERSYEMDDAKILLKQKSSGVYAQALSICLQLDSIYPGKGYLGEAFLISEKNKASVMSAQIRERNFFQSSEAESGSSADERNIRYNIARLNSKSEETRSLTELQKVNDEKSVYETRLVNLRKKMEGDKRFYNFKYSDDFPSILELQRTLDKNQALISFYNLPDKIEVFVLNNSGLKHVQLDSGLFIFKQMSYWIEHLKSPESGNNKQVEATRESLFNLFMQPILKLAGDKNEWVVIPDGLLFQLPVESLNASEGGELVLEHHAVSYEFSARFMMRGSLKIPEPENGIPVLAFAPFSGTGINLESEGMGRMEKLPYSREEVNGLNGRQVFDQQATKQFFLSNLNKYSIVHLATHAVTDIENPSASYIAFYPSAGLRSEDFLFLDEIYSLKMDNCQLMVISACETGRGAWVNQEGVMSFARAFLYSGCPSTINTLWKADDHSTAEIMKLFYRNLQRGDTKTTALQKAKLDFIHDNPLYRNPAYWSHLILTGNPNPLYKKSQGWIWAVFAVCFSLVAVLWIIKQL